MLSKLTQNDQKDEYSLAEVLRQAEHGAICSRRLIQRTRPKVRATLLEPRHYGRMVRDPVSGQ